MWAVRDAPEVQGEAAAQRYADWAERLRAKRRRDQDHIRGTDATTADPGHWHADTVMGGDHVAGHAPVQQDAVAALGVLGLAPGASVDEIALAYRRLAKLHHPDRWAEAPPEIQGEHAEAMLRINAAYRSLRAPS
jgi:DnaJ-domain-containing protein 1